MTVERRWWLYVLRLEGEKYYVGITSKTPEIRMYEHKNNIRSAYWTAKYKPVEVIYREDMGVIEKARAEKRENKMVRAVMKERGVNNVRGGDLRSTDPYIQRFGYYRNKDEWSAATVIVLLLGVILYLFIDKYFLY